MVRIGVEPIDEAPEFVDVSIDRLNGPPIEAVNSAECVSERPDRDSLVHHCRVLPARVASLRFMYCLPPSRAVQQESKPFFDGRPARPSDASPEVMMTGRRRAVDIMLLFVGHLTAPFAVNGPGRRG
jgi:hypothetical protein